MSNSNIIINKAQQDPVSSQHDLEHITLDNLLEKSLIGAYLFQDGIIRYINPQMAQMLGYTIDELIGKEAKSLILPEDLPVVQENIRARLSESVSGIRYSFRAVKKNKEIICFEVHGYRTTYEGRPAIIGTAQDVTAHKLADDKLRESEEYYRTMVDHSNDMIWTLDTAGNFTYFNKRSEEISGYKLEDWRGKSFAPLIVKDDLPAISDAFQKTLQGTPQHYEARVFNKEGNIFVLSVNSAPIIKNGKVTGTVSFGHDITERKKIQEMLIESEEKYRIMVENSNDLIWTLDIEGRLTFVNNRALEIGGYSRSELDKKHFSLGVHPDDLNKVKIHVAKTFQGESQTYEVRVADRHGKTLVLLVNAAPLYRNKQVIGVVSFGHDITQLKQQAEDLKLLYEAGKIFCSFLDEKEALEEISRRCAEVMNVDLALVRLIKDNHLVVKGGFYRHLQDKEEVERLLKDNPIKIGQGIAGRVAQTGEPLVSDVAPAESLTLPGYANYLRDRKWLVIPMKIKERVIGVLTFITADLSRVFSEHDISLAQGIANQAAIAAENARLFEDIERSERRYRTILDNSADAIINIDSGFKVVTWSNGAERIFGYCREEIIGQSLNIIVPESEWPVTLDKLNEAKKTGFISNWETMRKTKSGRLVDVEITLTYLGPELGFIGILRDITERKRAETEIQQSYNKLHELLKSIVYAMAKMVEKKDPYTAGHHEQTSNLACAIAEEIQLNPESIEGLRVAGILHDISKIYIPTKILNKPKRLTGSEFKVIETHPQLAYDILKLIEFPWSVAQIVFQHHERMNGSGYPMKLSGNNILLEARILAVADVVDAMISDRPYRKSLGIRKALKEISDYKGILYDPKVVEACVNLFVQKGFKLRSKGTRKHPSAK
ncbi:MAG: PAS domain S-box protein [Planctomycetes bacterium]|nr:PAS domain S-box protein [Planctomycetota bacterium]